MVKFYYISKDGIKFKKEAIYEHTHHVFGVINVWSYQQKILTQFGIKATQLFVFCNSKD